MANTNKNRKLYVCATVQPEDLDQAGYEALVWVQVKKVGSIGETGTKDNVVSYDTLEDEVIDKNKGISNAGDPVVECARVVDDPGQIILRACGATLDYWAFKVEDDDAQAGYTPSTYYNRGLVIGPVRPNGRNESFNLEQFTLGLVQKEIVVDPVPQSVPVGVTKPTMTWEDTDVDTLVSVGDTLTAVNGTYTNGPQISYVYQWQADTAGNGTFVDIGGATSQSYVLAAGQSGDAVRVGEKPTNGAGQAVAFNYSLPVGLVQA